MQALVIVAVALTLGVLVILWNKKRNAKKSGGSGSAPSGTRGRDKDGMASE